MFIEFLTDSDTVEKSRRSLIASSALLLFVSALNFRSEEIDIFGLKFGFSQGRIILIGQVVIAYILFRYVVHLFIQFLAFLENYWASRDNEWEKKTQDSFYDTGEGDPSQPEPESYELKFWKERESRENFRLQYSKTTSRFSIFSAALVNVAIPLFLGALCLFNPDGFGDFLATVEQKSVETATP